MPASRQAWQAAAAGRKGGLGINLLGLDVGWSERRRSCGVAFLCGEEMLLSHVFSAQLRVGGAIPAIAPPVAVAIDAPVLGQGADQELPRLCEQVFIRTPFHNRCKPGLSHVQGTGHRLREEGKKIAAPLAQFALAATLCVPFPRVLGSANVVEAFPNAFLGVALAPEEYNRRHGPRGLKFMRLYEAWRNDCRFEKLGVALGLPATFARECCDAMQRDRRAALVCLLTAAAVAAGHYTAVGDPEGGYFFLPPWEFWKAWARHGIADLRQGFLGLEVWIDGTRFLREDLLPGE
jgi:hypothetical protein